MDSKILKRALLAVTLFALSLFALILLINDYGNRNRRKSSNTQEANIGEAGGVRSTNVQGETEADGMLVGSDLSAWMNDETFFDEIPIGKGKYDNTRGITVVISASSVEKDIRVKIFDEYGTIIKGRKFEARVGETLLVTDDDMDGIIHITDLTPGAYEVVLEETAGYIVPTEPLICNVRAKLEYKAIDDISYLIKTEADIDAEKEDTAIHDAGEQTSGNSAIKTVEGARFGVDVSKYNGFIDWKEAKAAGVEFAIIRCGYRGSTTGAIVKDPYFEANMEGAIAAGIPVGVYFFTQAINNVEAVEEASAVMELVKPYKLTYPIFIDTEGSGGRADNLEKNDRSYIIQTFCETIRSGNNYTAGVYASRNWLNNKLDITKFSADNVIWLAEYGDKPTYGGSYQLWQYSSAGSISGIEGRVDMNVSYLDVAE